MEIVLTHLLLGAMFAYCVFPVPEAASSDDYDLRVFIAVSIPFSVPKQSLIGELCLHLFCN